MVRAVLLDTPKPPQFQPRLQFFHFLPYFQFFHFLRADGVDHLAEAGTVPQESEGDLGVRHFAQGGEQLLGFVDSVLCVLVSQGGVAYGAT